MVILKTTDDIDEKLQCIMMIRNDNADEYQTKHRHNGRVHAATILNH